MHSPFSLQPSASPFPLPPPSLSTDREKFDVHRNVICMCGTSNVHLIDHSRCHMRGAHFPYSDLQIEDQRRCGLQTSARGKEQDIKWCTVIFENKPMDDELQQLLKERSGILSDIYPLHMLIS